MDWTLITQPLLAGLSVGAFCLTYCFPFMGTYFGAEERRTRTNLLVLVKFLAGRFAGYLGFGLLAGYLGKQWETQWLRLAMNISFIVLSGILCLYLLGIPPASHPRKEQDRFCPGTSPWAKHSPLAMGFFMGINLCPPFLLSVAYVFSKQSALYGMVYFALFFLTSSLYFLPLVWIGLAARAGEFRSMARLSGFLVAIIFFIYGLYSFVHN